MKKLEKLFQSKIFIFDFSLVCVILALLFYFFLQNIFFNIKLKKFEKDVIVYNKISYPISIQKIKNSYAVLKKKFRKFSTFIEEKKDLVKYLPFKTLIYVPKQVKESNVTKEKKDKKKDIKKEIRKVFRKKIKLFTYLKSIIYNPHNPKLSFVYISISNNKHALKREEYYLKESTCIYIKRKKINFCIDKIKPDYVKVRISIDNGDKTWVINLYPGIKPIYLEY